MAAKTNLVAALVTIIACSTTAWAQGDLSGSGYSSILGRNHRPQRNAAPVEVITPAPLRGQYNDEAAPPVYVEVETENFVGAVPFEQERRGTYGRPQPRTSSTRRVRGQIPESRAWDDPNAPLGSCRGHMIVLDRDGDRNTNREVETRINLSNMGRNASNSQSVNLIDDHSIGSTRLGTMTWRAYHNPSGRPEIEVAVTDRRTNQVVFRRQIQGRWDSEIQVTIRGSTVAIPIACSVERSVARRSR